MKEVLRHRSHRRFDKYVISAARQHQTKLAEGKVSLPTGLGKLAIIVSRVPDHRRDAADPREQHRVFLEEAKLLEAERKPWHQGVEIRRIANIIDMKLDFGDPEVTDIILIGHGCISALWAEGGQNFDWRMAAKAATYLKQGRIEQRMCGDWPNKRPVDTESPRNNPRDAYTVPLGTFAVTDLTNVIAATAKVIPDAHPAAGFFEPVYERPGEPVAQIQALNERYAGRKPAVYTN